MISLFAGIPTFNFIPHQVVPASVPKAKQRQRIANSTFAQLSIKLMIYFEIRRILHFYETIHADNFP